MQRIYKIARIKTIEVFTAISVLISRTLLQHNTSLSETLLQDAVRKQEWKGVQEFIPLGTEPWLG